MATSEGIPSSIGIEFLELNDNPYLYKNGTHAPPGRRRVPINRDKYE